MLRVTAPLALALLLAAAAQCQSSLPNLLAIIGDDITCNELPLYGGVNIKTPNTDRLASEGMTFDRAYLSIAMCNPCWTQL